MTSADLKSSTIMMVDDEPTTLDVLEMFLEGEGYENIEAVTDSTKALETIQEVRPDVLLLDLNMPEVGGVEILSEMNSDEDLRRIPVLILTSSTSAESKLQALELGAADFLAKPVDPSELALRIRNTLAAKSYQDHLTYHDGLTGLPNGRAFKERAGRALQRASYASLESAVLHIGLDRFKQINDSQGHSVGDAALRSVAERLRNAVRPGDVVGVNFAGEGECLYRVGGDEFIVCLPGIVSADRAARVARRIIASLSEPLEIGDSEFFLTASIGIALHPSDGDEAETLMRNAHVALSHAKESGRSSCHFYSSSLNTEALERLELESDLRRALERGELSLHYQPKVDLRTDRLVGFEALMRWSHPTRGVVPPDRFIPIAEEAGLITDLGTWALDTACAQLKQWRDQGHSSLKVAVNVSTHQFYESDMASVVLKALRRSGLEADGLVLELTESMLMQNPEEAAEKLERIRRMGVRLSVDDFGTGYSSLSYLKQFPLDELKIDRSFIKGIPDDVRDLEIVSAVIGLAHGLGLSVVAEGIETEAQREAIAEHGCEEFQGYLFSAPRPPEECQEFLELP